MSNSEPSPSIGLVSTFPPTPCGLATFTASLRDGIAEERGSDAGLPVVSLVEAPRGDAPDAVAYEHRSGAAASLRGALRVLNSCDVVSVQHEYGIFAGPNGSEVLELLAGLQRPAMVTLHTVLGQPSRGQRTILQAVAALAERTIVMSETARRRLVTGYYVDPSKVHVIPHGASVSLSGPSLARGPRPVVLTWGLIGPGKGLELAIDAVAGLQDLDPLPRYVILGKTHPKVEASQGTTYRDGLIARSKSLGLEEVVEFDGRYLNSHDLAHAVRHADVVVLPYESTEQVTSGVLVEAIAAGKPVVATAFPHAVDVLSTGAGIVVPHGDREALTAALRKVLTDRVAATDMARKAAQLGSTWQWPEIGRRYHALAVELATRKQDVEHDYARVG